MQPKLWIRLFAGLLLGIALLSGASNGIQHRRTYPTPPAPGVPGIPDQTPTPEVTPARPRLDGVTMEREAKEMAVLAGSVPGDVEQLKKGLLPKDAYDKLKRIEKLAKQLRGQIRP